MITTIIFFIIIIKLVTFKGFFMFLTIYSFIYLFIKFITDKDKMRGTSIPMHTHVKYSHFKTRTIKSDTHQKMKQRVDDMHKSSTGQKSRFVKSTVTIKKIIIKKTQTSTKDQLIIQKSQIMKTKKIVTIKSSFI